MPRVTLVTPQNWFNHNALRRPTEMAATAKFSVVQSQAAVAEAHEGARTLAEM